MHTHQTPTKTQRRNEKPQRAWPRRLTRALGRGLLEQVQQRVAGQRAAEAEGRVVAADKSAREGSFEIGEEGGRCIGLRGRGRAYTADSRSGTREGKREQYLVTGVGGRGGAAAIEKRFGVVTRRRQVMVSHSSMKCIGIL